MSHANIDSMQRYDGQHASGHERIEFMLADAYAPGSTCLWGATYTLA